MTTKDPVAQRNRFQAEMPRIPGVNDPERGPHSATPGLARQVLLPAAAALAVVVGGAGWMLHLSHSPARASSLTTPSPAATAASSQASLPPLHPRGPEMIATVQELAKPWSSKKFTFYRADTGEGVPAMIIRLPGVPGSRSDAYWAFSLNAPYELCQLDYITNLAELAARFDYHPVHPMVASSCSGSVYDPLRIGTAPDGAWVRGEVMTGSGIRPPMAIEVSVRGRSIIVDKIEQ
jgi:hypothetical protein